MQMSGHIKMLVGSDEGEEEETQKKRVKRFTAPIIRHSSSFILQHINHVLSKSRTEGAFSSEIGHIFLVGGFAESPVVQDAIRQEFSGRSIRIIIPQVRIRTFNHGNCSRIVQSNL